MGVPGRPKASGAGLCRDCGRHTGAIGRIRLAAVVDVALDHGRGCAVDGTRRILEENGLLLRRHFPEKVAGLRIIVGVFPMVPTPGGVVQLERRFGEIGLLLPRAMAVRLVGKAPSAISVDAHRTVTVVAAEGALRRVDGNLGIVDAEPVTLRVSIGEQTALKKPIRREAYAGYDRAWAEGRLFDFGEEILRVAVELHDADFDERIVRLRPDLCRIERMMAHALASSSVMIWM